MRLLRYGEAGHEKPGLLDDQGTIRDLSGHLTDIGPDTLDPRTLDLLRALSPTDLPPVHAGNRIGAPVAKPGNIICIGLNYPAHTAETGFIAPKDPLVFAKHTASLSGPNDPILMPKDALRLDWEVELAVVIGTSCLDLDESEALSRVAGYTVANDVSERSYQLDHGGQWGKGKSRPSFCPLGPVLVTVDECPDPQSLSLWLEVNGQRKQNASTVEMIFPVAKIVAHLSRFMALLPGDIICTGTPSGVGMGHGEFLKPGDTVRLGIEGIGEMTQTVVSL